MNFAKLGFRFDSKAKNYTGKCHSFFKDPDLTKRDPNPYWIQIPNIDTSPALQYTNVKIKFSFHCSNSDAVFLRTAKTRLYCNACANFALGGLLKMQQHGYVTVRGKKEAANIGNSETGHPNMSCTYTGTLGWVDFDEKIILNKSTPGIYSFLCKSTENRRKKISRSLPVLA
jgi:hypothetical protein